MTTIIFQGGLFAFSPLYIEQFDPHALEIVICHIAYNGKFLLLKRAAMVPLAHKWSMPGGKIENHETLLQATVREVKEETAIQLVGTTVDFIQTVYIRRLIDKENQDIICHLFKTLLPTQKEKNYPVVLNHEHVDHAWVNLAEADKLDLIAGGKELLHHICIHTPN